jgi:predicted acylesterase/phospholipase RssA
MRARGIVCGGGIGMYMVVLCFALVCVDGFQPVVAVSAKRDGDSRRWYRSTVETITQEAHVRVVQTIEKLTRSRKRRKPIVTTPDELRRKVLDEGVPFKHLNVQVPTTNSSVAVDHEVLQLLTRRFRTGSKPGKRDATDTARLALSMEGGGMRGSVTAGMASAIDCLGLTDCFDIVYGSSAGSVIGAYLVSGQMCMDVYIDILPAAKKAFVCIKRLVKCIVSSFTVDRMHKRLRNTLRYRPSPGMNISFVLDGIMHPHGLRPLDVESFQKNDRLQPLRVVSSYVKNGMLRTRCFGTDEFFPGSIEAVQRADGGRQGLFACLEASMCVPGATGPPVELSGDDASFFDAFCFEPLPYRSAVAEGATHVLVCASQPEGFQPSTKPGIYERGIAPLYFRSHNVPEAARFFERGGQQYIYAEDLLTLQQGKHAKTAIRVPPPDILYGAVNVDKVGQQPNVSMRRKWKTAHILPLKVPQGTAPISTLEQNRVKVLDAVRGGFAAAFDLLAPVVGVKTGQLTSEDIAILMFPGDSMYDTESIAARLRGIIGRPVGNVKHNMN